MNPIVHDQTELEFARMMLAAPTALNRAVYADWLETEADDIERATLVRATEKLPARISQDHDPCELGNPDNPDFTIVPAIWPEKMSEFVALIYRWGPDQLLWKIRRRIRPDGTSPDGPENWGWLLSLAMDRGLEIPGLSPAPVAIDPELER